MPLREQEVNTAKSVVTARTVFRDQISQSGGSRLSELHETHRHHSIGIGGPPRYGSRPTPPCVRVRNRRFSWLSDLGIQQRNFAGSRNDGASVWNVTTGRSIRKFTGCVTDLKSGEISPDGHRFSAGLLDGRVLTWDTATGDQIGRGGHDSASVNCLLYSEDGQSLLYGDWNGRIQFRSE